MKNLRLTLQLGIALSVSFALFVLVISIAMLSFSSMDRLREDTARQAQLSESMINAYSQLRQVRLTSIRAAIAGRSGDLAQQRQALQSAEQLLAEVQQSFDAYLSREGTSSAVNVIDQQLGAAFAGYVANIIEPTLNYARRSDVDGLNALTLNAVQPNADFNQAIRAILDFRNQRAAEVEAATDRTNLRNTLVMAACLLFSLMLCVVTFLMLRRSVVTPLVRAQSHFERIAQGDLSRPIETLGRNEIGQLYAALGKMQNMLKDNVSQVREGAQAIHHGAREIAQGNTDLSSRTEQQAASLEETASSMEQMTSTVRQNAANAEQARSLANRATGVAERGGEEMKQVVGGMEDISNTAGQISSIIAMIDGIAFQTNILALNASVEAARAGEHGRGFAVVAGEVRNLATRSAEAAGEIKNLIENVSGKIDAGSQIALSAGKTMQEVVDGIREVNQLVSEIASASKEQSDGIEQVNQAVSEMDSVTQQNAALVEQAAAAAASLERQAAELAETVERFRLGDENARETSQAPSLPRPSSTLPSATKVPALRTPVGDKRVASKSESVEEWTEF
ncbi:methyl-accepting chemotaxis protein [Halotalea alkalilenta]|uniref:Chemotaxis protein n=1 Tax=Halotalea alkalilenta TaxID=376489 RepID=A0A172YGE0_9GAMM|nr:methyl-accepting chemotaxis protein [Halotalea alkalilenta]ANF58351.1 hypothetical protein A5892_13435 [Halotalea alkalilenta]